MLGIANFLQDLPPAGKLQNLETNGLNVQSDSIVLIETLKLGKQFPKTTKEAHLRCASFIKKVY